MQNQIYKLLLLILIPIFLITIGCDETCSDGILNQDETNIDCGGGACTAQNLDENVLSWIKTIWGDDPVKLLDKVP